MTFDPESTSTRQWFDYLMGVLHSERFLKKQGIGNEVPFFVFPFPVKQTQTMTQMVRHLVEQLPLHGVPVLHIDLYDLAIELLRTRGIWDQILESEPTLGKDELLELLQNVLDPETHLVPAVGARMSDGDPFEVLLLTGVGEVFPYLRSHTVLNNLQAVAKEKPTLLFFPGKYAQSLETGASLDLFDRFHDDKYYRAFNICYFDS